MDYENANKLLNLFSKSIISNVGVSSSFNFKTIEENVKILANYDFDGNNNFIESLLKIIISNPNENSNDLFEFLILQRYADDIEGLSSNIILYAKGYLNNNDFINAKKYC